MSSQPTSEEKKTLLLVMKDGLLKKITIPRDWKVTFGPIVPGSKDGSVNSAGSLCLRLWSGTRGKTEIQHAVFTEVHSFRDMSIELTEQVEKTKQENFRAMDPENEEVVMAEVRVKEWVNPDKPEVKERAKPEHRPGSLIELVRK